MLFRSDMYPYSELSQYPYTFTIFTNIQLKMEINRLIDVSLLLNVIKIEVKLLVDDVSIGFISSSMFVFLKK